MINDKKVRVLYIVESFSTGVYAIVRDVACNLDPTKFEVLIVHSLRDDSPKNYKEDFKQENVTLCYLAMGNIKEYLPAVKSIKKIIKEFKPHTIHVHSSKGGFLGRLAIKGRKNNVFYSPHGFSFIRTDVGNLKRFIFFQLEYWINKFTPSKIIAVSESEKQHALRITKNAVVINNFLNSKEFEPLTEKNNGHIVACGRITKARNPQLFNSIAKSLPNEKFMWIGDGPLRNEITSDNIKVTGLLSRNEAISFVRQADIYLQTSLWEGMPVALLEAMALEKPVIASNIIGNKDLITNNETGLLCSSDNLEEFVQAVKLLLNDDSLKIKLAKNAREHILKNHDAKSAITQYEKEYLATY